MIPALFFTADIQHAIDLSAVLRHHGVRVYPVSGKTPTAERQRLVRLAREGQIDGLASCDALTVGTDIPIATLAAMCRDTQSGLWYRQAVGRVLRKYPTPQGDRPYQRDALVAVWRALQKGILNQLVVMPTGVGKTVFAAKSRPMIAAWKKDGLRGRIGFSVHRDELAEQAANTFAKFNPELKVGIEKSGSYAEDADVVIFSIQTVGPANGKRLAKFNPGRFDEIFTDEAHWGVTSKLYENFYQHFRIWKKGQRDPGILHIGMTATPKRSDGVGLEKHYDEIVYNYPLLNAIKDGWLSPLTAYRAETKFDISKVGISGQDFVASQLEKVINTPERNELVAQKYLEVCALEKMDEAGWRAPEGWVKPKSIVIDYVDLCGKHSLVTAPTLMGLPHNFNARGADLITTTEKVDKIRQEYPNLDLSTTPDMSAIEAKLQSVDILAPPVVPPEIREKSRYSWLSDGPGAYHMGLFDHRVLTVRQNALGQWEVKEHNKGVANHLWNAGTLREALQLAEKRMPASDQKVLKDSARWKQDGPTVPQAHRIWDLDVRVRRRFSHAIEYYEYCRREFKNGNQSYNKGGLSRLIDLLDTSIKKGA